MNTTTRFTDAVTADAKELRRLLAYQRQLERLISTAVANSEVAAILASLASVHEGVRSSQTADTLGQLADYGAEYSATLDHINTLIGGEPR